VADEQKDWKKKYKELALEMEQLQSSGEEETLRTLVSNLLLTSEGADSRLDNEIAALRGALDKGGNSLEKSASRVISSIRNLDGKREESAQSVLQILLNWISAVRGQLADQSAQKQLAEIEDASRNLVTAPYQLPSVMSRLLEIQRSAWSSADDSDGYELDSGEQTLSPDQQLLLDRIGAELLEMLSSLYIPKEGVENARAVVRRIEAGVTFEELAEVLNSIVNLVQMATSNSHEDFENYLITLNQQLAEVQSFLDDSRSEQGEAGKMHRKLDQLVRRDVSRIHKTVKDSIDLDQLKGSVATQLAGIVRAMDDFRKQEEARENRMNERYEALMDKVDLMEEETLRVKAHMEEERLKARTDPLTNLPNRASYDDHIVQEYERWSRYRTGFAIAVGDLDYFKNINDTYGHLAGDKVLRLIGKVLSKNIRATDFIARFGGEEFVMILPSTSTDEAVQAVDKMRKAVESCPFNFHGAPVNVTMSFGVAEVADGDNVDELFQRADDALYKAKETGRNRVCKG